MSKTSRWIVGVSVYTLYLYLMYILFLFLSNNLLKQQDSNGDVHGFLALVMGSLLTPAAALAGNFIKNGSLTGSLVTGGSEVPQPASPLPTPLPLPAKWVNAWVLMLILSLLWTFSSRYCDALFGAVWEAAKDEALVGVKLSPIQLEKLSTTIGGTLYLGSFLPLTGATSFLGGWLARKFISVWHFLLPAVAVYGMTNYRAYQTTGHLKVVSVIQLALSKMEQEGQTTPVSQGDTWLIGIIAAMLFLVVVLLLALYGWAWAAMGYQISRRFCSRPPEVQGVQRRA